MRTMCLSYADLEQKLGEIDRYLESSCVPLMPLILK